jgi:acetyl-CoA synthetase
VTVAPEPVGRYRALTDRLFAHALSDRAGINIGGYVDAQAARESARPAVLLGDQVLTYGALADRSSRLAAALRAHGVSTGDRVAVCLPQGPDCATAHAGVLKAGGVSVPLSRMYGSAALTARLEQAMPRLVICEPSRVELFTAAIAEAGCSARIVVSGEARSSCPRLADLIAGGSASFAPVATSRDDPALLLFTSGTTGPPKGALHAHRVVVGHAASLGLAHNIFPRKDSVLWTPADWSWAGGLVNCLLYSWYAGVPIVATPDRPFDPEAALRLLADNSVTAAFLPPTALKRMRAAYTEPVRERTRVASIMSGSESLDADLLDWSAEYFGVLPNEVYGQTEASAIVGNCSVLLPVRPGSIGVPYPGGSVVVIDDDGNIAPPGSRGELAVSASADSVFLRYWQDPESTAAKFTGPDNRWMRLGDTGWCDEDGYLWFSDRRDDVINSSGYRIGPSEVERCLRRHSAVLDAAVVGLPDPDRGSVVAAFVELRDGHRTSPELERSLADLVATELAPFQRPRRVHVVDALPRTVTGKVRRAGIREEFSRSPTDHPASAAEPGRPPRG